MAVIVIALLIGAPMFVKIGAKEELEAQIEAVRAEAGNAAPGDVGSRDARRCAAAADALRFLDR